MPDLNPIHEMEETDIDEVSSVDLPATARRWTLFKSLGRKVEAFAGLGSGATGTPTSGPTAPGLPNLEQLLADNPDMDPAVAEAIDAGGGLADVLMSDMPNGDEGTVSDPPTAGDFVSAKRVLARLAKAGIKGPEVDECVQSALANPEFGPGDFPDRESRAFAICTEQFATEDGMPKPVLKQDEIVPVEPEGEEPVAVAAIEIETAPVQWPFATCVADAQELGMGTEDAAVTCMLIREDFGDPDDEETILVPEGMTPEGLLTSAAIAAGVAAVAGAGGGGGEEATAEPEEGQLRLEPIEHPIKFDGKNRWKRSWRDFLGLNRRRTLSMPERALRRLGKEVAELKDDQIKSRADLQAALNSTNLINFALLRALGVDTTDLMAAVTGQVSPTPATEATPASIATEGVVAPDKRAKDDAAPPAAAAVPAAAPAVPAAASAPAAVAAAPAIAAPPEGLVGEELLAWYRDNYNRISAIVAAAPMPGNEAPAVEAEEEEPDPIEVALAAAAGTAEGVDLGPEGEEEPDLVAAALNSAAAPVTTATIELVAGKGIRRRKSAGPTGAAGRKNVRMVKSTLLGGALIPADDRKACGW